MKKTFPSPVTVQCSVTLSIQEADIYLPGRWYLNVLVYGASLLDRARLVAGAWNRTWEVKTIAGMGEKKRADSESVGPTHLQAAGILHLSTTSGAFQPAMCVAAPF